MDLLLLIAGPAAASPLGDALIHHGDAEVAMLRGRLDDPVARCTLGAVYGRRGDLPRAALFLDGCDTVGLDPEFASPIEATTADVQRKLRMSELSALLVVTNPPGMIAETDALPGEHFTTPATVWAHAGTYKVRAARDAGGLAASAYERSVKLGPRSRGSIIIEAGAAPPATPRNGSVDFNDEPTDPPQSGPPPAIKHPSLLPCKYEGCDTHAGESLADPFELVRGWVPTHPAAWRIGIRAGFGAADHDGGSRIGPSLALVVHRAVPGQLAAAPHPFELELRVLYFSERGGADAKLDVLGTSLGLDRGLAAPDAAWLSVGLAVRGEARFGDAMEVHRYGVGGAATVELALRTLPIVIDAVYEQGITDLMPGTREHAFILELGADWRVFRFRHDALPLTRP